MDNKQKGFTLFELLVSISIIAILIAVTSISFGAAQRKARDAKRQQDMGMIQKAAEQYYSLSEGYQYPTESGPGVAWTAGTTTVLEAFPADPRGGSHPDYSCSLPGSGEVLDGTAYCCCALMENTAQANSNDRCEYTAEVKEYYCVRSQQ